MGTHANPTNILDELTPLVQIETPKEVTAEATPRGGTYDTVLRWLSCENTYINPHTKQEFQLEITTNHESTHTFVQKNIRIAARAVPLGGDADLLEHDVNTDRSEADVTAAVDGVAFQQRPDQSEILETLEQVVADSQSEQVQLALTVTDAKDVQPPYRILFAIEPPVEQGTVIADTHEEGKNGPTPPAAQPLPRNGIWAQMNVTAGDVPYTLRCNCKTITVIVHASQLQPGHRLTASLYSLTRAQFLDVATLTAVGHDTVRYNDENDSVQLTVRHTGRAQYLARGDYF